MALNLYRRHGTHCLGGRALHHRTYEADELRRGWKKCACPIYASGTLNGRFKRKNTERADWTSAKTIAAEWEKSRSWDGTPAPPPPLAPVEKPVPAGITVSDAIKVFLTNREGANIAPATLRKYRTFTKKLADVAELRGDVMLDQLTSAAIDVFYGSWKLGARAKAKRPGTLRAFFRFCAKRKWVPVDATDPKSVGPVSSDLKPPIWRKPCG